MGVPMTALHCRVDGQSRYLPADDVRLVTLRVPIEGDEAGPWVGLDDQRWPFWDPRDAAPLLGDHFVFLQRGPHRRVVVVDRVLGLVGAAAPDVALAWVDA